MRNKFIGGPNDGQVHLTFDLLTDEKTRTEIPWEEYYNKGETEPAADGEIPVMLWYHIGDATVPSETPQPRPTATTANESGEAAAKPEKSELRVRREAIKVKRQDLADQSGVTIGVLARLETKGGTDEELAPVLAKLAELESVG